MDRLNRILHLPLVRNTMKISASNIVMFLLPLIVTPVLSRLYSPAQYGEWGIFSSFVSIICLAQFAGFDNTLVKCEEKETGLLATVCALFGFLFTFAVAIVFYIGSKLDLSFFASFPNKSLLVVYLLVEVFYTIGYNLSNRQEKYNTLSVANIVQGGSQALFRIIFGISGILVYNGLILGTTIALLNVSVFLFIRLKATKFSVYRKDWWAQVRKLIVKYRKFPLYDAPSSILSFAAFNLPTLILAYYFGKKDIGCFSMVMQLLLVPMSLVGSAMGRVYYQEICKENTPQFTQQTTERMVKTLGLISILPLLFLVCGGDKILVWFLGAKWHDAGMVALSLSLWSFPTILTQPLLPLFRYQNKQNIMLLYDVLYFIFGIGSIIVCCALSLSLISILTIFSISCFAVKMSLFVQLIFMGKARLGIIVKYMPVWAIAITGLVVRFMLA